MIFAIDPGTVNSAYALLDENLKPIKFGIVKNEDMLLVIQWADHIANQFVIERLQCYGMPVGSSVLLTCEWVGRFAQAVKDHHNKDAFYIDRKDEKIALCGTMKANDSTIIRALKDRFGDKGTKDNPGWFYGVSKDVWQAIAVGVTFHDIYSRKK